MMTFSTAKILLFIGLTVGSQDAQKIFATSNSESYVWTQKEGGWYITSLGFPQADFSRNPSVTWAVSGGMKTSYVPAFIRPVAAHDWHHKDSVLVLDNGDRVEKHGKNVFYIVNAGGANEKDFTIFYPPAN